MIEPAKKYWAWCRRCQQATMYYSSTGNCIQCTLRRTGYYWKEHRRIPEIRDKIDSYYRLPTTRAKRFLAWAPDCTSSAEEVEAAYATCAHVITGEPGKIGKGTQDLAMGHIKNGPIVGLIWGWENTALSRSVLANWATFLQTAQRHLDVMEAAHAA